MFLTASIKYRSVGTFVLQEVDTFHFYCQYDTIEGRGRGRNRILVKGDMGDFPQPSVCNGKRGNWNVSDWDL